MFYLDKWLNSIEASIILVFSIMLAFCFWGKTKQAEFIQKLHILTTSLFYYSFFQSLNLIYEKVRLSRATNFVI